MGISNGTVSDLTKIHDGGAPSERWNLVFVSEGYRAAELAQFHSDAQAVVDQLFSTPPFDEEAVACAINIYRLDVASDESGADKPDCADLPEPHTPTSVDTYFDATFCARPMRDLNRSVSGDDTLAQSTVEEKLPEWKQIIIIVNDSQRGGTGGSIAWFTTGGPDWRDVAIHELGHSAFNLADEYDYDGDDDRYSGTEPMRPNVTIEPDPALVKWSALVTAGSAVPTMENADCSTPNDDPSPVAAGVVGTFEGAHTYHCGVYRPQHTCMMREAGRDFCAVCQKAIRDTLAAYAVPAVTGDVAPDTLSLSFDDIPEGTSTVRPIVFNVDTCLPVTFEVTALPAAPFSVAFDPIVVSNTDTGTVRLARVWMRYDCTAAGTNHSDSVDIRLAETGQMWSIPLTGNCVARPNAAVQLVIDQSGSMLDMTSEGRLKKDVLKKSVLVLADVAYEDTGLGANTYDDDAHPLLSIVDAGAVGSGAGREALRTAVRDYEPTPGGLTAIGDGIEFARDRLNAAPTYSDHAMIVLTDGRETAAKYIADVDDTVIDQQVFAIGLGTAEQIRPAILAALAGTTGGYILMTGLLTTDDSFLLEKYYLQILAGVSKNDIILDPEGRLTRDHPQVRIAFDVTDSDIEITAIALADVPEAIGMALEAPDGAVFDAFQASTNPLLDRAISPTSAIMRASLPLVSGAAAAHAGRWHMILRLDEKNLVAYIRRRTGEIAEQQLSAPARMQAMHRLERLQRTGVRYSAVAQTYSNLRMHVALDQTSREPGAEMLLMAQLTEYGGPFRGSARITVDVTDPNNAVYSTGLAHQGEGVFTTALIGMVPGIYYMRVRGRGTTERGRPFTREQLRTGIIWIGGDRAEPLDDPDPGRPDSLSELLCCIYRNQGLSDEFLSMLKNYGIQPEVVLACLKKTCT